MLVDDLLPALGVQNDHEAVEAGDDAPQLEPVDQDMVTGMFCLRARVRKIS